MEKLIKFLKDEDGVTAVEYAILAAVVVAAVAAVGGTLTNGIGQVFNNLVAAIQNAMPQG